jgi:transcriptional regulator with XRE-family HTH domain
MTGTKGQIGARLRAWREGLGLTQAQMAQRTGIPLGVLKKYEQAVSVPGGEALAAIARTGVNMTWLLTGDGDMSAAKPQETAPADPPPELGRHARRLQAIARLLDALPPDRADAILTELLSRAQDTADAIALRRELTELRAALRSAS